MEAKAFAKESIESRKRLTTIPTGNLDSVEKLQEKSAED